ncbi:glycosyltransferase family 4 protein [Microcella sp.]|uniref:glycosyltransferase family 4 protein n=1 Tax=Microcella sp. TaxID=1913979 RepID=UPI00255E9A91|nr:glycosyltransferase family 1 protein [Microcella sp.]MBX9472662.1 glycosyltransferase family 1 protein [Microcella sp.]
MRVAVVSESFLPTVNGVTTSVLRVLEHLRARGHETVVIAPAGAPARYAGARVVPVPTLSYREFPVGLPTPIVSRTLADFAPDVVHAASPFLLGAHAIGASWRLGIPSVAIFQTDVAGYAQRNRLAAATSFAWRVVNLVHDKADLTLAPSSSALYDLAAAGVQRLDRWGRGVDLDGYHPRLRHDPDALALRARLAPDGELLVGYVGRLAPEKQVERFATLRGVPGIRIVIVGDGPSAPSVRSALAGMPVEYLGALHGRQLALAYASFDVFAHTGCEETFGQTIQEAQASGLPVIAPRSGGPIDLIDHGRSGLLTDPDNPRSLRTAVRELAADAAVRARLGESARRSVLGRTWQAVGDELIGHYERVIDEVRARRSADAETMFRLLGSSGARLF